MKIKFQQINKQDKVGSKSVCQFEKQNIRRSNQKSNPKSKRAFGNDITKKQLNQKYHFIVPSNRNLIQIPSHLIPKIKVSKQTKPYEEQILNYIINTHDEYDITVKAKGILKKRIKRVKVVQYFIAICNKYKLKKKTLFLSTYYFDKYLDLESIVQISAQKQALIAEACLLIAMKYQEIYPPYLKDWASDPKQVIKMEAIVIKALNFKLSFTTARHYLQIYLSKKPDQSKQRALLYECILEFYLVTGKIYRDHPLKIVQETIDFFRTTSLLEGQTYYNQLNKKIQLQISQNKAIWDSIIENNLSYQIK